MSETFNKVSLVVDKDFGNRLESLVTNPVWIIDSPVNRMAVEAYRQQRGEPGVTAFNSADEDSASAACLNILDTVELHHGEYSGGYSVLEVIGTPLGKKLHSAIKELGFTKFESTAEGFRANR